MRRPAAVVPWLVVGCLMGCSATSTLPPTPGPTGTPVATTGLTVSPATGARSPGPAPTVTPHVVAGVNVAGAFDAATDGSVIAWSSGTVDTDAPALWAFDPATGRSTLVYRSGVGAAILANLALRHGTYAFAEITPRPDGSNTWRLMVIDPTGAAHVLDTNDVSPALTGVLPMPAISHAGVLWATNHQGMAGALSCELRYASLAALVPRVLQAKPCRQAELWYPRSDGASFVYGTVEHGQTGAADDRHVYRLTDGDLATPRQLDGDGEASLPDVLGDTVVWKSASRDLNMFSFGDLREHSLASGQTHPVDFLSGVGGGLTTPTIGPGFYAAENADSSRLEAWDRAAARSVAIDRLGPGDPGFLSGARLSGELLIWLYTSSTRGGGTREIRWLSLGR